MVGIIHVAIRVYAGLAMNAQGEDQVGRGAEEAPAMVHSGMGQKIEALQQPRLHACEAYGTLLGE